MEKWYEVEKSAGYVNGTDETSTLRGAMPVLSFVKVQEKNGYENVSVLISFIDNESIVFFIGSVKEYV